MAGFELSVSIDGEKQVSRVLGVAADGVKDFTEPLTSIAGELTKTWDMNFEMRGNLFGGWPPRKKEYDWPLLEKTGDMRNSFGSIVEPMQAVLYNSAPYFRYHQRGTSRLPARVMMRLDRDRKDFVTKAFQSYIVSLFGRPF